MAVAHADPGAALAARIERRVDELARTAVRAWRADIPDAAALPPDMRENEHGHAARAALTTIRPLLAAVRIRPGEHPADADRQKLRQFAARQAEEGQPLAPLLAAYAICGRVLFDALRESARPDGQTVLPALASRLMRANAQITDDAARAYQNELAALSPEQADRHRGYRALVRDLLAGIAPARPSLLAELGLTEGAVVLAVRFSGEPTSVLGTQAVQEAIERHFGRALPMLLEIDCGHVLVPHELMPDPQGPALDEIAARIAEIQPSAQVAAAPAHSPAAVPAISRTVSEVLRLAGRLGRPAGAYRLADVLLEYHLTRRDESAEQLDALLAPLAERPELLETLRVYLEENYDRRRTAQRLSLHPNTVDNRLARTTELTGLDPSTPRGVALLMTALALRDLG
jgi:hypothetical protein